MLDKEINKGDAYSISELIEFSNETWNQKDGFNGTFPYIEISEIDLETGEINTVSEVPIAEAPSRARMVIRTNDIIVSTTRPSRGAISLIEGANDRAIASTGFAILRKLKTDKIERKYLFYILRQKSSLTQMLQRSSGGNYPAITLEELGKIRIPVPPINVQRKIVDRLDLAYLQKKAKEQEADEIIKSIDKYTLDGLGIKIPKSEEKKIFAVKENDLKDRLDPAFYMHSIYNYNSNKYKLKPLGEIASFEKGKSITKGKIVEGKYPVIAGGQTSRIPIMNLPIAEMS